MDETNRNYTVEGLATWKIQGSWWGMDETSKRVESEHHWSLSWTFSKGFVVIGCNSLAS